MNAIYLKLSGSNDSWCKLQQQNQERMTVNDEVIYRTWGQNTAQ